MKRIFKRLIAVLCICTMLFSISGCVSTPNTDDAKPLSANSSYNIDDYEEESVKIDLNTGMSFSEKGSVRFEQVEDIDLVDFWEYGSNKSQTIYFKGLDKDSLEFYPERAAIEFAFEYKNMIYFLKRTFDKQKQNYSYTLYRTNLKGEDTTKISTITLKVVNEEFGYYGINNVYVKNNSLIFTMDTYQSKTVVQNIDLKTGITKKLLEESEMELVDVRVDNDFTYLYFNSNWKRDPKVYKVDNSTNESSSVKYKFGLNYVPKICAVYNDILICKDKYSTVSLVSTDKKPKTILDGVSDGGISNIFISDNNVIININNGQRYSSYDLEKGKKNTIQNYNDDISHAVFKLGDKYLCYIDVLSEDENFDMLDAVWSRYGYQCYYWSSVENVNANKHNFERIKNQHIISDTYIYPYVYDEYEFDYDDEYQQ